MTTIDRRALVLGAAAGLAAAPHLTWADTAQDWNGVVAAAKKEGGATLYTAFTGQTMKDVVKAFETKHGIPVEMLTARPAEIRERVRVDQSTGRFSGDVMFSSESQTKIFFEDDKTVDAVPMVPGTARLRTDLKTYAPMLPMITIPYGFMFNTSLVKPEDEPRKWADLADPKWKGKLIIDDPRTVGAGSATFWVTYEKVGKDLQESLAASQPMITRESQESMRRVARGERALYLPITLPYSTELKGLPIKAVVPEEGVPYVLYGNSLLRGSRHPNAARLFIDFCLSEEALLIFARQGFGVSLAGLSDRVSPEVRPFVDAKLLGTSEPSRQDAMLALAASLYK